MTAPVRHTILALAVAAVLPLPASAQAPRGYAVQSHTPEGFRLPEGTGCAGDIDRWQAVQGNDYAGGNVSPTVYRQIQGEIDRAAAACAAGQEAQARRMVAESKRRHGYPP